MKNFCPLLLGAAMSFGAVFAAQLRTVDGKIYRDVQFSKVNEKGLVFMHSSGLVTLPPDKLNRVDKRKYELKIAEYERLRAEKQWQRQEARRQETLKNNKRLAVIIKKDIEKALQAETAQETVKLLTAIKEKYSNHPLIVEVDSLIIQHSRDAELEKVVDDICASGDAGQQIEQLKSLLDKNPGIRANLAKRVTREIDSRQKAMNIIVDKIEKAIASADACKDKEQAISQLKNLLVKYPQFPYAKQQQRYVDRVKQLIAAKEQALAAIKQKISARFALYRDKNPDIKTGLEKLFLHEEAVDHELGEKIFTETLKLGEASDNVLSADDRNAAIQILKKYLETFKYARSREMAERMKDHAEKLEREKKELEERIAKIRQIKLVEGNGGPLVIRKKYSRGNKWTLLIISADQRSAVRTLLNRYATMNESARLYARYQNEDLRYAVKKLREFNSALNEVDFLKNRLAQAGLLKEFSSLSENTYSIKYLDIPVCIIAWESNYTHSEHIQRNYLYKEYIPGQSSNSWLFE